MSRIWLVERGDDHVGLSVECIGGPLKGLRMETRKMREGWVIVCNAGTQERVYGGSLTRDAAEDALAKAVLTRLGLDQVVDLERLVDPSLDESRLENWFNGLSQAHFEAMGDAFEGLEEAA